MLYASTVADMAQYVVRECALQGIGSLDKEVILLLGEIVKRIIVATNKV
jgi:hypothetical protein